MWQWCLNIGKCDTCSEWIHCWSVRIFSALITIGIRETGEERWSYGKKLTKQKKVQPSGAGRAVTYPLRKPESVIVRLADTFSISSLSRGLGARTFCGRWIQDLKRSVVGFRINNDTNRKRLNPQGWKIKSKAHTLRNTTPPPTPKVLSCGCGLRVFLSCTPVVYVQNNQGQNENVGRTNISERNFTGRGYQLFCYKRRFRQYTPQSLTFVLLSVHLCYTTNICLDRQQQPTSRHHQHNLYFPYLH